MLRDTSTVAFGKSIRKPGVASHEHQKLLWHPADAETLLMSGNATSMDQLSEAIPAAAAARSVSTTARLVSAMSINTAVVTPHKIRA